MTCCATNSPMQPMFTMFSFIVLSISSSRPSAVQACVVHIVMLTQLITHCLHQLLPLS